MAVIFSGPRCILKVGGNEVGFGADFSVSVNQDLVRVPVLGDVHDKAIEVVGISVTVSMSLVRINAAAGGAGNTLVGSPEEMGMMGTGTTADIINALPYTIEGFDQVEGGNLIVVENCRLDSHDMSVSARGLAGQNISFQGIKVA